MGGAAKSISNIGNSVKKVVTNPGKANFGDFARAGGALSIVGLPATIVGDMAIGGGNKDGGYAPQTLANENPKMVLAQSGGAPLLANIAMGADVEDTLAGYFGRSKGADWDAYKANLPPDELAAINGVQKQLNQIQSNTNLRNQAVQKIVQDFPNIAATAAQTQKQAKTAAGEEFDSTTKGYIDQALNGVAAKYAAGGNLSSGAMAAASARAGAQIGMDKLGYVTGEGDKAYDRSYNAGVGDWQARYNEASALRNFQNLMTGQAAGNGFSAVQASLQRNQQTNMANASMANQRAMQDSANKNASDNALFGAIGSLAGTAAGAMIGGPVGASIGAKAGGSMGGASDYGFSGPASPGYARNMAANDPTMNWR